MRSSRSTHLLMFLFGDFNLRIAWPILMDLIDLVNSVIIFLPQTTLLSWLTFLLRSQLWLSQSCFFYFFISSDASICFTMAFTPFGNSDLVVVSVCSGFPWNSLWDAMFHCIAYQISSNKHLSSNKCRPLISASPWVSTLK